jgi:ribosomal protein S18 acetylase RimI-like enzyme
MAIEIRKAQPADAQTWCEVFKTTWLATYPNKQYNIIKEDILTKDFNSPEKVLRWRKSFADPGECHFYTVLVDGKIVGCGIGRYMDDWNEVGAIYVLPKYQGQGIGRMIMTKNFELFDFNKITKVNVVSYNENAIKFYEKFGFRITDEPVDPYILPNGKVMPEIVMIREKS